MSSVLGFVPASQGAKNVNLGWDANSDSQIVGYRLYYGTTSGSYQQQVNAGSLNSVTISLNGGSTYYAVVTSYNAAGVESLPSGEISFSVAPESTLAVSLNTPSSTINGPTSVALSASASDTNASVTRIEFYAGSTKLGTATDAPYGIVWNNVQPGNYNLSAVAYDTSGAYAISAVVPLSVVPYGFTNLQRDGSGNYQLTFTSAPGSTCSVLVSEDLVNWRLMQTVTSSGGTTTISDNTAYQVPRRFYKLAANP